jgi:hypothetical protein
VQAARAFPENSTKSSGVCPAIIFDSITENSSNVYLSWTFSNTQLQNARELPDRSHDFTNSSATESGYLPLSDPAFASVAALFTDAGVLFVGLAFEVG